MYRIDKKALTMIAALLGKKVGMTQVYDENGRVKPVTVIKAGPCVVLDIRKEDTDGYEAVQLGFEDMSPKHSTRPMIGHFARGKTTPKRMVREFRMAGAADHEIGDVITVETFETNETKYVDVVGTSKGRGFAGVMKRHNFGGQPDSHGTKRKHRSPGSISSHASDLGHGGNVKKGKRMPGHMGNVRCTTRNQELVGIVKDQNLLLVQGAVPGPKGALIMIRSSKTKS